MRSLNQSVASMMNSYSRQRGVTLVIALILLVVLTLLVLSGVVTSSLGFRIATNMQQEREAAAAAQAAIDARIGNANYLSPAPTAAVTDTIGAYAVTVAAPRCLGIDTTEEKGKKTQIGVEPIPRYLWEYSATARNANTGVEVTVVQGVRVQMNIGSACPN
jgi:Tfp pilus assembly protein PilX